MIAVARRSRQSWRALCAARFFSPALQGARLGRRSRVGLHWWQSRHLQSCSSRRGEITETSGCGSLNTKSMSSRRRQSEAKPARTSFLWVTVAAGSATRITYRRTFDWRSKRRTGRPQSYHLTLCQPARQGHRTSELTATAPVANVFTYTLA